MVVRMYADDDGGDETGVVVRALMPVNDLKAPLLMIAVDCYLAFA